jgi:NADH-quinone oxidoreductase subunit C
MSTTLIETVRNRFPDAVSSAHAFRGDETVVLRREFLLEVARCLKEDPAFGMNFLIDLTAVDYSAFGKHPPPAFFVSSGVPVSPASQIPEDGDSAQPRGRDSAQPRGRDSAQPRGRDSASPREGPWPGPPGKARFAVVYHFFSKTLKHRLRLVVPVEEADAEVDSLISLWSGANWLEREVWDMFGIRFKGHPDLKRILMYEEFGGHPLRKDYPVKKRQPLIGPAVPSPPGPPEGAVN